MRFYQVIQVRDGIEPSFKDLQSTTLPLCYLTFFTIEKKLMSSRLFEFETICTYGEYNLVGKSVRL